MLSGLLTTTMVTVLMCASVFQRRSRNGFLDDLETVRGEALTAPQGEVATAVALADAEAAQARLDGGGDDELAWHGWPGEEDQVDETDDIWTQPSPHPIRPQEMWHAGSSPTRFDAPDEQPAPAEASAPEPEGPSDAPAEPEEQQPAAHGEEQSEAGSRRRFARFRPAEATTAAEPVAPLPEVPVIPSTDPDGLLGGPVARRDRSRRERRPLPTALPLRARTETAEDRSPLTDAPLPPAAPPVTDQTDATLERRRPEPTPRAELPTEVAPVAAPRPELVIDDRSELAVGSTVVRFGDGSRPSMEHGDEGPVMQLDEGWCWVTVQGDGPRVTVRVQLPNGDLVVGAGGRVLAVVEHDRSSFVVIVEGSAELVRSELTTSLGSGSLVLLPLEGDPQVDQAEAAELQADPLVARNLALDASR